MICLIKMLQTHMAWVKKNSYFCGTNQKLQFKTTE